MSLFKSAFDGAGSAASSRPLGSPASASPSGAGGKKRKRSSTGGKDDKLKATQANLAALMERVDAGGVKEKSGKEGLGAMPKKKRGGKQAAGGGDGDGDNEEGAPKRNEAKPGKGKGKGAKRASAWDETDDASGSGANSTPVTASARFAGAKAARTGRPEPFELPQPDVPRKDEPGLTDMQRGMKAKLEGARFRWINEQLYSTASTDAVAMMKKDPKIFADYHLAHRAQTAAWPAPPLPLIVDQLRPLPRGTVIADLGCGDAGLARALVPDGKVVLSYDLVGDGGVPGATEGADPASALGEGWVVQADFLTHIPLPGRPGGLATTDESRAWAKPNARTKSKRDKRASEVVDAAVCCLSLMGTNWLGGVYEAARVLKQGGTLHIAEVTSRFVSSEDFVSAVESFGFVLDDESSPSTHFTLYRFTKRAPVPQGPARGERGWDERVRAGEDILRACVYKKR